VKRILKRVALGLVALVFVVVSGVGIYACVQTRKFDASMETVYTVGPLPFARSTDPAVIERGKHLATAVAPCTASKCHGGDLGGGETMAMGPVATLTGPNISASGVLATYSDGELARLLRHGIKKDGRSIRFMPVQDFAWLPDSDIVAIISYVRTLPGVDKPNGPIEIKTLGKVLDVRGAFAIDVARRIDHEKADLAPPPSPTADYGKYVARMCTGCHGELLSGGPLPGAPPSFPPPLNLTPHETGLKGWTYEDFDKLLTQSTRKNGEKLKPFMPVEAFGKMNETEKKAVFAYLQTVPPVAYGNR
jgi:hypothetical protein